VGRSLQREKIIGDVHLAFYADRTAKIPTVAPRYISFNIVEHTYFFHNQFIF
jgi:thiol-activated cytolysin